MKLQKIGETLYVAIPIALARAKGWIAGDSIETQINEKGDIVLKKIKV